MLQRAKIYIVKWVTKHRSRKKNGHQEFILAGTDHRSEIRGAKVVQYFSKHQNRSARYEKLFKTMQPQQLFRLSSLGSSTFAYEPSSKSGLSLPACKNLVMAGNQLFQ